LSCSGIETNDSIETALQKMDEQICSLVGDYSNYNFNCLPDWYGETITTEAQFVDAITSYACEIVDTLEEFTGTTFPAFQTEVETDIENINSPSITCAFAGVTSIDSLTTVLTKYCVAFSTLEDMFDISGVDWDQCYTVTTPPTTLAEAFSIVIDQICQTKTLTAAALPTFNNSASCISGGSNDSLATTIALIKTRLCLTPTLDNDNLSSDCISIPSTDTDLETLLQNMLDKLDLLSKNYVTFDGSDFLVTQTDAGDVCDGISVALATPLNQDRFVASNAADASPGTLEDKLTAGTGISLDFISTPGECIIEATSTTIDTANTVTTTLSGDGSSGSPLEVDVEVSATSGNLLTIAGDGLLVNSANLVNNGLNYDSGAARIQLGGDFVENTNIGGATDFDFTITRTAGMANVPKFASASGLSITDGAAVEVAQLPYVGSAGYLSMLPTGNKTLYEYGLYAAAMGQTAVNSTFDILGSGHVSAVLAFGTMANTGDVTHFANFKALAPRQQAAATSFSGNLINYYGILLTDASDSNIAAQITNKYGVYQEGASDINYFAGKSYFGTTYAVPSSNVDINDATGYEGLRLRNDYTPSATADANGSTGQITWDADYIYVKTAAGWKRSALATF
jgi:hypothetical protein